MSLLAVFIAVAMACTVGPIPPKQIGFALFTFAASPAQAQAQPETRDQSQTPDEKQPSTKAPAKPSQSPKAANGPANGSEVKQQSSGANSPNIVGNGNQVIINQPAPATAGGFHEQLADQVIFSLGSGGQIIVSTEQLRKGKPIAIVMMGDFVPIQGYLKGDTLYCDVKLWSETGQSLVEVKENEFVVRPPNWDRNFSSNALEVVDEKGAPILQVIRKTASHWVINGMIVSPVGVIVATDQGTVFGSHMDNLALALKQKNMMLAALKELKPIFKYPSYQHPGELLDK